LHDEGGKSLIKGCAGQTLDCRDPHAVISEGAGAERGGEKNGNNWGGGEKAAIKGF